VNRADDVRRDYGAVLSHEQREALNYEICSSCDHTRQWHLWGPFCRKTDDCQCQHFVPSGRDFRDQA
jgi:hypothetical protein